MNYKVNLNLVSLEFKNSSQKHINYLQSQFFDIQNNIEPIIKIVISFKKIKQKTRIQILEDTLQYDLKGNTYVLDTQKNKVKINFSQLTTQNISIDVDHKFDLYYLYSHILEPLLIIFGTNKGLLFVHSSAVEKNKQGILYPAWRHTGKTHLLLTKTILNNYSFMGDDFTILYKKHLYLYPKMINLFSYNLKGFPKLYSFISSKTKYRLLVTTKLKDFLEFISYKFSGSIAKITFRISQLAEVSTNFKTSPEKIGILTTNKAPIKKVVLLQRANYVSKENNISKNNISLKLTKTIIFEIEEFLNIYKKSCYIAGKKLNKSIETFEKNYFELALNSLSKTKIKMVKPEN